MPKNHTKLLKLITVFLLLLTGAIQAMSLIPQLPLTGAWKERFEDVAKLNAYAKTKPIELSNAKIANKNIDGAVLNGGEFKNNDWTKVSIKKANLTNVVFREGILEDVDFSESTLTNVVFEDVKLLGATFFYTTLNNVRFVRCTFNGVGIEKTKMSRIEVIDSKAISSSFSDGQLVAVFRNSKLTKGSSETSQGVRLTDLIPPSSLTFEKSELTNVNMDRSRIKDLVVVESNFDGGLQVGNVEIITIRNSVVNTTFSETTIGKLSVVDSTIKKMMFNGSKVGSMSFEKCGRLHGVGMYQAIINMLSISRCPLDDFDIPETQITNWSIKDSSITNSKFEGMKTKSWVLDTVSLSGELDFTGAHVGELKTNNVTKQPGLKLITTNSNVRF